MPVSLPLDLVRLMALVEAYGSKWDHDVSTLSHQSYTQASFEKPEGSK